MRDRAERLERGGPAESLAEPEARRRRELAVLHEASLAVTSRLDPWRAGERIIAALDARLSEYRRASLWVLDETGEGLELLAHSRGGMAPEAFEVERTRVQRLIEPAKGIVGWVATHGVPLRLGRVRADPRYVEADPAIESELCVPLTIGGRSIGSLNVESTRRDAFTEEDERLLAVLAGQAAVTIEHARAEAELEARLGQQAAIATLGQQALADPDLQALMDLAVRLVAGALGVGYAKVLERRPDGETFLLRAGVGWQDGLVGSATVPAGARSQAGYTLLASDPVIVKDLRTETRFSGPPLLLDHGVMSGVSVPIGGRDDAFGVLGAHTARRRRFSRDDVHFVQGIAHVLAAAIERRRSEDARQESEARFRRAFDDSRIGRALQALDGRYQRVNRALCQILGRSEAEVLATSWQALTHPEDLRANLESDARIVAGEIDPYQTEKRYLLPSGRIVRAAVNIALLRDAAGAPVSILAEVEDITSRKEAETALRQHAERLRLLREIDQAIMAARSPEAIAEAALRHIRQLVPCDRTSVSLFDPDAREMVLLAVDAIGGNGLPAGTRIPAAAFHGIERLRVGEVVAVEDLQAASPATPAVEALRAEGRRALLRVPLLSRGALVGSLNLTANDRRPFPPVEVEIAREVAVSLAVAIENARLARETQRRQWEAETLVRLAGTVTEELDVAIVAERIVNSVPRLFGVTHCTLTRLLPNRSLIVLAQAGAANRTYEPGQVIPPGVGLVGRVVAEGRPVQSRDVTNDPGIRVTDELRGRQIASGLRGGLCVPLRMHDTLLGVLGIIDVVVREFSAAEVSLLQAFADQAAVALRNSQLYEEATRQRHEAEVIATLAASIAASLDLETVLERVVEGATVLCKSDLARIALREAGSKAVVFRHGAGRFLQGFAPMRVEPGQGIEGLVLRTGLPCRTADYAGDPRFTPEHRDAALREGVVAVLAVPIRLGTRVEGLLGLDRRSARPFTDEDEAVLVRLAEHAALAIQNARLYREARNGRERLRGLSRRLVELQEAERRHIARELHDEIGQLLTGLKLTLELDVHPHRLREAQVLIDEMIGRVRRLSLDLRPAMLDDLGLLPALLWHLDRYAEQTRVVVRFEHQGLDRRLSPELETTVYRLTQEALTNVARHARVAEATLTLRATPATLHLTVADRGVGFDAEAALADQATGGLAGMRERVGLLGGHLIVESAPGSGTRVIASFPLGDSEGGSAPLPTGLRPCLPPGREEGAGTARDSDRPEPAAREPEAGP